MSDETTQPAGDGSTSTSTSTEGGAGLTGSATDRPIAPKKRATKRKRSLWIELPILAAIAIIVALVLRTFLVETFYIPSGSMENTLLRGDKVLVNKVVYHTRDPHRGEVIVFVAPDSWRTPGESKDFIKRVMAVGGDHVSCAAAGARLTINGDAVNENAYLYPGSQPCLSAFNITVPANRLFVCGDHRDESADSRRHLDFANGTGTITSSSVVGRAFAVVWPASRWAALSVPAADKQIPDPTAGSG